MEIEFRHSSHFHESFTRKQQASNKQARNKRKQAIVPYLVINFIIIYMDHHQQNEMNIEVTYRSEMKLKEPANKPLRVLFLSSDTGGGHRASGMFNVQHGALCFFT